MNDTITSTVGDDGAPVTIENAIRGMRYRGRGHHDGCELYPVFRGDGKRSSFAHIPNRSHCAPPSGESSEHKKMKTEWLEYLEDKLSNCRICRLFGRTTMHLDCPLPTYGDSYRIPEVEIMWRCTVCHMNHLYNILKGATSVVSETWQFGQSCRSDITILDIDDKPLVFIEFKKTNVSQNAKCVAKANGVHLFVVDVLDGKNVQAGLNNPQHRWYDSVDMDEESKAFLRAGESINLTGTHSAFESLYDDGGNIANTTFSYSEPEDSPIDRIPQPRLGHYMWASWSTMGCESQRLYP